MKKTGIVTDSHSSISQTLAKKLGIRVLPMPFYIDGVCYYEETTLSREEFFKRQESGAKITTSQPSPEALTDIWDEALAEYEEILHMPISSGLSGSCSTAHALAEEEPYRGRVFVVDNGRVSTPLHRSILDALELIEKGYRAEKIRKILEEAKDQMVIYLAVETLRYLKEGGRVTPAAAALGTVLNIKPILRLGVGLLDSFKKCRGFLKAKKVMIETLQEDLQTRFQGALERGEVYLLAASSAGAAETQAWIEEIKEAFPGMEVLCDDLSLGVSCHTGPGALGIGCSCRPVTG